MNFIENLSNRFVVACKIPTSLTLFSIFGWRNDLVVAYLNDAGWWLHWIGERGCVSWQGYNIFLTSAYDWIHNWIRYWTRKWDTALVTSAVWPNSLQRIIAMLSGRAVGQFHKPSCETDKRGSFWVAPKGATPMFPSFPVFWGLPMRPSSCFWRSDHLPSEGPQKYRLYLDRPSYGLV